MPIRTKTFTNDTVKSKKKNKEKPLFIVEVNFEKDGKLN